MAFAGIYTFIPLKIQILAFYGIQRFAKGKQRVGPSTAAARLIHFSLPPLSDFYLFDNSFSFSSLDAFWDVLSRDIYTPCLLYICFGPFCLSLFVQNIFWFCTYLYLLQLLALSAHLETSSPASNLRFPCKLMEQ